MYYWQQRWKQIKQISGQFVAHPNVQQLLASIWYEGLPGFRQMNMILQVIIITIIITIIAIIIIITTITITIVTEDSLGSWGLPHRASLSTLLLLLYPLSLGEVLPGHHGLHPPHGDGADADNVAGDEEAFHQVHLQLGLLLFLPLWVIIWKTENPSRSSQNHSWLKCFQLQSLALTNRNEERCEFFQFCWYWRPSA